MPSTLAFLRAHAAQSTRLHQLLQARQRYPPPPHTHTSPLATLCVNVMFSQEPVEPNGRMPYVASCASPKPASLWSATHALVAAMHPLVAPPLTPTDPISTLLHHIKTTWLRPFPELRPLFACVAKARRAVPGVHHRDERAAGHQDGSNAKRKRAIAHCCLAVAAANASARVQRPMLRCLVYPVEHEVRPRLHPRMQGLS